MGRRPRLIQECCKFVKALHRRQIERELISSSVLPEFVDWVVCDRRSLDEVKADVGDQRPTTRRGRPAWAS